MKLLLLFACLSFSLFPDANETLKDNSPLPYGQSSIEWLDEMEHDFGDLEQGKPVEHHFKFTNHHDEPVTIDNIRTTCGCTSPDWSEAIIEPGASDVITITYDSKKTGYFRKKIKVYFNHQRKAEILYVEGFVLDKE